MNRLLDGISSIGRAIWNDRAVILPALIVTVLLLIFFRYIRWGFSHARFCVRLRRFCRKNRMVCKSDFLRTLFRRRSLLGYAIRLSDGERTLLVHTFPYCCRKRVVHLCDDSRRAIIYKETVQVMHGRFFGGVTNGNSMINQTVTRKHERHLTIPTDGDGCFLVFTSSPVEVFVTTQGRRDTGGSGYTAEGVTLYDADDFLRSLQRGV